MTSNLGHLEDIVPLDRDEDNWVEELYNVWINSALVELLEVDDDEVFCIGL